MPLSLLTPLASMIHIFQIRIFSSSLTIWRNREYITSNGMYRHWSFHNKKVNFNVATILYLHRINDNRMAGSLLKNLRMFISMCGQEAMPNVVLVMTIRGELRMDTGERREKELKETFWKEMLDNGCRVECFGDPYESAWSIINCITTEDWAKVQLSDEMVERRLKLQQTTARITMSWRDWSKLGRKCRTSFVLRLTHREYQNIKTVYRIFCRQLK